MAQEVYCVTGELPVQSPALFVSVVVPLAKRYLTRHARWWCSEDPVASTVWQPYYCKPTRGQLWLQCSKSTSAWECVREWMND